MKISRFLAGVCAAAVLSLLALGGPPAQAQGLWPNLPNASFPLTGDETIPADTNLSGGVYPQTERITVDKLVGYVRGGVPLTDGATVSINAALSNLFFLTLGTDAIAVRTIETPTNPQSGQVITLILKQGSGGSETVKWGDGTNGSTFAFGCLNTAVVPCTATAPTLSTTANAIDVLTFVYNGATWLNISRSFNMTSL